jgi:hypothetical protein
MCTYVVDASVLNELQVHHDAKPKPEVPLAPVAGEERIRGVEWSGRTGT